jgi:hypothetical protein
VSYAAVVVIVNTAAAVYGPPAPTHLQIPDKTFNTPYECAFNAAAFAAQSGVVQEGDTVYIRCEDTERPPKK